MRNCSVQRRLAVTVLLALAASSPDAQVAIGAGLGEGLELVYESAGSAQPAWIYDSVRVVPREGFERCVTVVRRDTPARESCVRGDTLFERRPPGDYAAARPLGERMELAMHTRAGSLVIYSTGEAEWREVSGETIQVLPTTVVTRDSSGAVTRRLREGYAPELLTATEGIFDEPAPPGGWRTTLEFTLATILRPLRRAPSP